MKEYKCKTCGATSYEPFNQDTCPKCWSVFKAISNLKDLIVYSDEIHRPTLKTMIDQLKFIYKIK